MANKYRLVKNIVSSEVLYGGVPTAQNKVSFSLGTIAAASQADTAGQIAFGLDQDNNYGAIFVGKFLAGSKILDATVSNDASLHNSVITFKKLDPATGAVSDVTFTVKTQKDLYELKAALIGTATVTGTDITIKGALAAAESAQATASAAKTTAEKAVVANEAITAGTFTKVTVDAKGLVTSGSTLAISDIPTDATHRFVTDTSIATWEGKQDALVFNTAYNAETNKVATMSDIANLTGAMHFKGAVASAPTTSTVGEAGDVVIVTGSSKEYVCTAVIDGDPKTYTWVELGDESAYVLKNGSISDSSSDAGVAVALGGTHDAPTVDVTVTPGSVEENNGSVVTGGAVFTAIKNKIEGLDGVITGTAGAGSTLTAFSETDGVVTATFGAISITESQISDFQNYIKDASIAAWAKADTKPTYDGTEVAITSDYALPASASAVAAGDTIQAAIAKVEKSVSTKNVSASGETGDSSLVMASATGNAVTVASTAKLQNAVSKAESALQSATIAGLEIVSTSTNIAASDLQTALGLGTAAYVSVDSIKNAVIGTSSDASTASTIGGLKNYVDAEIAAKVAAKNVSAEGETGDSSLVIASAEGNKVTVASSSKLQNAVAKAESAVQSVAEGTTNGTVSVDGTDVAVHGLGTAAYTASTAYDAAGAAATAEANAIAAVKGTASDVSTSETVAGAKKYADAVAAQINSDLTWIMLN